MPPPARPRRVDHPGRAGRGRHLSEEPGARPRAPRLDPDVRRGLIVDAAERVLVEGDPLLVTFDQVARAAGVSRALVHTYLGDRRGLLDAVQVRIIGRLDAWVAHGLARAPAGRGALRAVADGLFAFVEAEQDAWSVLAASGGLDHPALHGVRARWSTAVAAGPEAKDVDPDHVEVAAQAAVSALVLGAGPWVARGVEPAAVAEQLVRLLP